jgi:hypothetical protein
LNEQGQRENLSSFKLFRSRQSGARRAVVKDAGTTHQTFGEKKGPDLANQGQTQHHQEY